MYKGLLVACLLISSIELHAQDSFFRKGIFEPSLPNAPVATFTASYVYQYAPNYLGANRSLMGWSTTPEVNLTRYLGVQAEFTGLYMRGVGLDQSKLMIAAGPRVTLGPYSKFTPFAFGEGGEIRSTQEASDASNWNPVATAGIGVDYKIAHGIAFQLIPGEYMGQLHDNGNWNSSFITKAGITFDLYRYK